MKDPRKDLIYKTVPTDINQLRRKIFATVRTKIRMNILKAAQNLRRWTELYIEVIIEGESFDYLL